MTLDPRTLPELARAGAECFANHPAIECVSGTERAALSYAELWDRARLGGSALRAAGLGPGDRVLLALPGGPEWAVAFFAIAESGLVAVPVAPGTPPATAAAIAAHAEARACMLAARTDLLALALPGLRILLSGELARCDVDGGSGDRRTDDLASARISGGGDRPAAAPLNPEAIALLCFTSGSTARPRAVALSHRNLLSNVRAILSVGQAQPGDSFLSMLPLSHLFEIVCGFLAPLACGARIVYAGVPLPNRVIDALREERITHALAVPALLEAFSREALSEFTDAGSIDRPRQVGPPEQTVHPAPLPGQNVHRVPPPEHAAHRVSPPEHAAHRVLPPEYAAHRAAPPQQTAHRFITGLPPDAIERIRQGIRQRIGSRFHTLLVGGAALDPAWSDLIEPLGIDLQVGYGLTEAGPIVSGGLAAACPRGSAGRPLPGVEVRVDTNGEILVRSPSVMSGYVKDPEATAAALAGGWLHTGDRGRLDPDGFLFVTGRLKEVLVTSAGETLYPEEVEPYYDSPLFAERCVVALPGPGGNDVPTLVIVPAAPESGDDELQRAVARLRAAAPARCRVAGFMCHQGSLPKTPLGKIQRRALADTLRTRQITP